MNNFSCVFLLVAVCATIGSGEYERRHVRPWNDQRLTKPIVVDAPDGSSSSSSSSEESSLEMAGGKKATTVSPDCKNQTESPNQRSGDLTRRRSSRLQRKSLQSQYTSDGATIPRRRSNTGGANGIRTRERDSVRFQTESDENEIPKDTSNYKLHLLSGRYVQYGDENRWTIWPRLREDGEGATHGGREGDDNYENSETTTAATNTRIRSPTTRRWVQRGGTARPELRSGGHATRSEVGSGIYAARSGRLAARPEVRSGGQAPRLELKSGDNVQFGDGISWQILRSENGLTRIGTIDGKVMVRIYRPYTEAQRQSNLEAGLAELNSETATDSSVVKCQMGQDCYNKMLNYQNYGFHLNH